MAYQILPNSHFEQRVNERMKEAEFNPKVKKMLGENSDYILDLLKKLMNAKYQRFVGEKGREDGKYTCSIVSLIKLKIDDKILKMNDLLIGNDSKKMKGDCFVACAYNNQLFTLLLLPSDKVSVHDLFMQTKNHFERKSDVEINEKNFDVIKIAGSEIILNVNQMIDIKNKKSEPAKGIDPKEYPYTIKVDYRKAYTNYPSYFDHKIYGHGSIIDSVPGGGPTDGVWEAIKVKFDSGEIKSFKDLKTKSWFLKRGVKI